MSEQKTTFIITMDFIAPLQKQKRILTLTNDTPEIINKNITSGITFSSILRFLFKLWFIGLIIFTILVKFIPKKTLKAHSKIYIGIDEKSSLLKEDSSSLYFKSVEDVINNMNSIQLWQKENNINHITFMIPRYEVLYSILYFYRANRLVNFNFKYSVRSLCTQSKCKLTKIMVHYNELIIMVITTLVDIFVTSIFRKKKQ